jgi:hypothetical protein
LFFIFVEVPSMGAMLVHKAIMMATGQETKPLNVWLYRLIGVTTLVVLVGLSFVIGGDAACLLLVLLVAGGLIGLVVRRQNAVTGAGVPQRMGPHILPGVLGELARRSLGDLRAALGRPNNPSETDIHVRSADLMAALRFYQVAVNPHVTDHEIGRQLAVNAPVMMASVTASYSRLPPSRERDVAIEILRTYLPQGPGVIGNVYTSFAGNALRGSSRRHS